MTRMNAKRTNCLHILIVFVCSLLFHGCEKAPVHGKLDGHWQLMSFETADGTVHPCERIYYSIQLQLVEISHKGEGYYEAYVGRFGYNRETARVTVSDFRKDNLQEVAATKEQLYPFGMNDTETVFDVIAADGKTLVLKSGYATLTFRIF